MSGSFVEAVTIRAVDVDSGVLALCCASCGHVVATAEELLPDRVDCRTGSVWGYELDLLETTAYCYSATNPSDARFDVARFNAAACARAHFAGEPSDECTWFPPHRWINASCAGCPRQVGWVFVDEQATPLFIGVIVTSLRERRIKSNEMRAPDLGVRGNPRLASFFAEREAEAMAAIESEASAEEVMGRLFPGVFGGDGALPAEMIPVLAAGLRGAMRERWNAAFAGSEFALLAEDGEQSGDESGEGSGEESSYEESGEAADSEEEPGGSSPA